MFYNDICENLGFLGETFFSLEKVRYMMFAFTFQLSFLMKKKYITGIKKC